MSLFKPATKKNRRLKILCYGVAGTGKTIFMMTFPRLRVVDLEGGALQYEDRVVVPQIGQRGDFEILHTGSAMKCVEAIEQTFDEFVANARNPKEHPLPCDTIGLDPMTVLWERIQEAYSEEAKKGTRFQRGTTMRDWSAIKRPLKNLITDLQNLPVHLVMTAHSGDKFEKDGSEGFKSVGTKAATEKSMPHAADTVIEFLEQDRGGGTNVLCHKDRTGVLKVGELYKDVSFNMWKEYLAEGGDVGATVEKEDISRDQKLFEEPAEMKPPSDSLVEAMLADQDVKKFIDEMDWPEAKRLAQAKRFSDMDSWKKFIGQSTREFRAAREKGQSH
jgi:AAA domain